MKNKTLENKLWDEFRKEMIELAVVYGERNSRRVVEFKELDFVVLKELFLGKLSEYKVEISKERGGTK